MEHSRPTLLWGIDCDSGKISALPASPLLLPAVIVGCIFWIIGKIWRKPIKKEPLPDDFDINEWYRNKAIYDRLCLKIRRGQDLTPSEQIMINCYLPKPSWAKPGEHWSY
jgi:hypothetical protein